LIYIDLNLRASAKGENMFKTKGKSGIIVLFSFSLFWDPALKKIQV